MQVTSSGEQFARVGEHELCYETFGDLADPALLLVMGLGTQMIAWHDDFCALLARRGFHVIRFDNRDAGRSSRSRGRPPGALELLARRPRDPAYTLDDMADDAAGLLDALEIEAAHVVGASLGGMIAQTLAVRHPDKVLSLCSIMSTTGARTAGQPSYRIWGTFLRRPPREREAYVDYMTALFKRIGSPGFERDEDRIRDLAGRSYDRGINPAGTGRQLGAILASGDRTKALRGLRVPTLVIHGDKDLMIGSSGGRATAKAIPGARLVTIDGMGHDLPRGAWREIADAIESNAARAGERDTAAAA
jgi:pimeloyl-ACP methyl ester carboxylesterase